jgi:hypothetical protein
MVKKGFAGGSGSRRVKKKPGLLSCLTALALLTAMGPIGCGAGPAQFLADFLSGISDGAEDFAEAAEDLDEDLEDADDGDDIDEAFEDFFDALFGG